MSIKHQMSAQLSQGISLTPQLLQSIRLLQLTAPQLELEVRAALERNPLLELDEPHDDGITDQDDCEAGSNAALSEVAAFDELGDAPFTTLASRPSMDGLESATDRIQAAESTDPRVRVLQSLPSSWSAEWLGVAAWWLDRVDDRGYLEGSVDYLVRDGATALGVTPAVMRQVRESILHGEFPGMGASSLQECLMAQLQGMPSSAANSLAIAILRDHQDLLIAGRLDTLEVVSGHSQDEVSAAMEVLRTLQPAAVEDSATQVIDYIVPDVVAWQSGGQWHVALNNASVPQVRVNTFAEHAVAAAGNEAGNVRSMLEEARWLVRGVAMRNETLLRTSQVLVRRQMEFLENGDEALVPLTLADVASEIEMHESTVSRITVGKVIQTPRGLVEMKQLFASRLDGAQVSGVAVRAMVKRMIDCEPIHAPLADATIATMLARKGIRVARRTVAKYRDQLSIGSARSRGRPLLMTGTN